MSENNQDQYQVVLTGQVKSGYSKANVIKQVAELFQTSRERISPFFQGKAAVIKSHISHKRAFQYKSKLDELGAEVELERIPVAEVETSFSMVPEGEEQTPYNELQQRISNGEQVACGQCGHLQTLAPNCESCGKPLIGITVSAAPETPSAKTSAKMIILSLIIIVLVAAGIFSAYFFK